MLGIPPQNTIEQEIKRLNGAARKKSLVAKVYVMLWTEFVYLIWVRRCKSIFKEDEAMDSKTLAARIIFNTASRCTEIEKVLLIR